MASYHAANDVVEAERRTYLAQMTSAESWAQWRDLVSSFNARPDLHENSDRLDLWRLEGLLEIRRVLDLLVESQNGS